jgi:benzoyl-CoA-dihydrodiol lyase
MGANEGRVDFATYPDRYQHWRLTVEGRLATLKLDVRETATLRPGYELKLNSYDLSVDIELYDATQRLRFEHPEVAVVILTSAQSQVFCAGANINMLAQASYEHKVNFCKFTNETRNAIEDASTHSGQRYLCALNGAAAGGGYELALACDYIMLIDDGFSTVSLPELPMLAVLPGTGGLTRLVDKRYVRPDLADFFCTTSEGVRGQRAVDWRLVDELVPRSRFDDVVYQRAAEFMTRSDRPSARGIALTPLRRQIAADRIVYDHLTIDLDRRYGVAYVMIHGPTDTPPDDLAVLEAADASFWPLSMTRQLDDAIMHLRLNETAIGVWVLRSTGAHERVQAMDTLLTTQQDHWLAREIMLYLKRTLNRLDVSSRSLIALIEPDSCFTGILLELVLAADRSYMLDGTFEDRMSTPTSIRLSAANFGRLPMVNGSSRLQRRFLADPERLAALQVHVGRDLEAAEAEALGLVTFIPDDIDWEDEVRLAIEERTSFSPDALSGMEASLRFAGPESLESKIFSRLSTWQNWIFQRPNATGEHGALSLYGTGKKSQFDKRRV